MKHFFTTLTAILLLSSCAPSAMLINKDVLPNHITNLGSHETISIIGFVEQGNKISPNDSLSKISTKLLDSIITSADNPRIEKSFLVEDNQKDTLQADILKVFNQITKSKKIENVKTTPLMNSVVKENNKRYGLCVINSGFDRRKGNYGGQIAKGIGIGILTLGMYTQTPIKANTSLFAMIYDAEEGKVVFFNRTPPVEKSPTDRENLGVLYNKLFDGYFYTTKKKK
ncbi:hypothetical protein [Capnocytophaga cynodegmi]|uniref:hypothetical protein n=1 Tax=Capnocytophaga cynodegmi TaxID=28189 RepID=UPI00385BBF2F